MPETLVPNPDNAGEGVSVPLGNEPRTAASVRGAFQALADKAEFHRLKIPAAATSYKWRIPLNAPAYNANDRFEGLVTATWRQKDVTDAGQLVWDVPVPDSGRIESVHVIYDGGGARSNLPATKPNLRFIASTYEIGSSDGGSQTTYGPETAAPANATEYSTQQELSVEVNANITPESHYRLEFRGETGSNSEADQLRVVTAWLVIVPVPPES